MKGFLVDMDDKENLLKNLEKSFKICHPEEYKYFHPDEVEKEKKDWSK